jgi:predicted metal-dependent hydrolase
VRKDARRPQIGASERLAPPLGIDQFKAEVRTWAERLDVAPTGIYVTGMRRKWASCSRRGRVTFDIELLEQPEPFRREAIVHELLHLKVRNHGPLFRALLSAYARNGVSSQGGVSR